MSNYKCNECDSEFDELGSYKENIGEYWGIPVYETFYCCPHCKSDDYEEVDENE